MRVTIPQPVMTLYKITGADVRPGTVIYRFLQLRGVVRLAFCTKRRFYGAPGRVSPQAGLSSATRRVRVPSDFQPEQVQRLLALETKLLGIGLDKRQARFTAIAFIRSMPRDATSEEVYNDFVSRLDAISVCVTRQSGWGPSESLPSFDVEASDFAVPDAPENLWETIDNNHRMVSAVHVACALRYFRMPAALAHSFAEQLPCAVLPLVAHCLSVVRRTRSEVFVPRNTKPRAELWCDVAAMVIGDTLAPMLAFSYEDLLDEMPAVDFCLMLTAFHEFGSYYLQIARASQPQEAVITPQGGALSVPVHHHFDAEALRSIPSVLLKGVGDAFLGGANDLAESIAKNGNVVLNLGAVLLLTYGELSGSLSQGVMLALACIAYATRPLHAPKALYDQLFLIFWANRVSRQSGIGEFETPIALLAMLASVYPGASRSSIETIGQKLMSKLSKLRGVKRFSEDLEFTFDKFLSAIQSFADWCHSNIGTPELHIRDDPYWMVTAFEKEVAEGIETALSNPCPEQSAALASLDGRSMRLANEISRMPGAKAQTERMSVLRNEIAMARKRLARFASGISSLRAEPVCAIFTGAPGIGKTVATSAMWPELLARTLPPSKLEAFAENEAMFMYLRNQAEDYWSGYDNQEVCLVDEIGALKDVPGSTSVWADIIQIVNTAPMALNQAHLEQKGLSYFTSSFVIGTTNRLHFDNLFSVEEKTAVWRRLRVYVTVCKREFATEETKDLDAVKRLLDKTKLQSNIDDDTFNFDHLEFHVMLDKRTGTYDPQPLTYDQVRDEIIAMREGNVVGHSALRATITKRTRSVIDERLAAWKITKQGGGSSSAAGPSTGGSSPFPGAYRNRKMTFDSDSDGLPSFKLAPENPLGAGGDLFEDLGKTVEDLQAEADEYLQAFRKRRERWDVIKKVGITIAAAVGLAGSLYVAFKFFSSPGVGEQAAAYATRKNARRLQRPPKIVPQVGTDKNTQDAVMSVGINNMFAVHIECSDGTRPFQGTAIAVAEHCVLLPHHFMDTWRDLAGLEEDSPKVDKDAMVVFTGSIRRNKTTGEEARIRYAYPVEKAASFLAVEVTPGANDDLALVVVPDMVVRRIINKFRPEAQMPKSGGCALVGLVANDKVVIHQSRTGKLIRESNGLTYSTGETVGEDVYSYDIATSAGDCGSALISLDKNPGLIVGIHVAGASRFTTTRGVSVAVTRERIEAAVNFVHTVLDYPEFADPTERAEVAPLVIDKQGGFTRQSVPAVARVKGPAMASQTTIVKSPIWGKTGVEPTTAPALLRKLGDVDPMDNAIFGYGLGGTFVQDVLFNKCFDKYAEMVSRNSRAPDPGMRRVFTHVEAIDGIEGREFCGPLSRSTSPGYPFCLAGGKIKKSAFEERGDYSNDAAARIFAATDEIIEAAKNGKVVPGIFMDFLKDERRPLARVEQGKTRLISAAPIEMVIAGRMYFLPFTEWMMDNRIKNEMGVGINPHSDDWSALAIHLGGGTSAFRVFCGDFSGFDKTLSAQAIRAIVPLSTLFYGDSGSESERVRKILVEGWCHSYHVDGDKLYMWAGSNPSGNPLTTLINSNANCILIRVALCKALMRKGLDLNLAFDPDLVRLITYGDDNAIALKRHPDLDHVTGEDLEWAFGTVGLKYTDADKSGTVQARTLEGGSFLKRGFARTHHRVKGRWMAPLDRKSIEESVQWTRRQDLDLTYWRENVSTMLREASAHGRDYYNDFSKRMSAAFLQLDEANTLHIPTFEAAQQGLIDSLWFIVDVPQAAPKTLHLSTGPLGSVGWRSELKNAPASTQDTIATTEFPATPVALPTEAGTTTASVDNTAAISRQYALSSDAEGIGYASPNHVESVIQYLARPTRVAGGVWATSDTVGSALFTNNNIWAPLSNNAMLAEKLKGFVGVRGTLLLKLQLNGTPFHAGRLRLSYYPCAQIAPNKVAEHLRNRISISQLPGIEITPEEQAVAIEIPYVTPTRYLALTTQARPGLGWAGVYLNVMAALKTGASSPTSISWTLWASIADAELVGQTNLAITPQSKVTPRIKGKRKMRVEAEGPVISSILDSGARLAASLERVPVLTPLAGSARWALNAAANVALALGFSKPLANGMKVIADRPDLYMVNADGMEVSNVLSLSSDAKLAVDPSLYPSGMDEMSIQFIKKQWSWMTDFVWAGTSVAGTNLYKFDLSPSATSTTIGNFIFHTPVSYLNSLFSFYRGGLEFRFKFNKTAFHAGSLIFSYVPNRSNPSLSIDESAYVYRTIVDMQQGQEVCLAFPYLTHFDYQDNGNYGALYVAVLNPLVAPESVMNSIDVSVYVRGMDDLEFQGHQRYNNMVVVPQGGTVEVRNEAVCAPVGDIPDHSDVTVSFAEASASEYPTSLRQLIKMYSPLNFPVAQTDKIVFQPWAITPDQVTAVGAVAAPGVINSNAQEFLLAPFAFQRGGKRVKVMPPSGVTWYASSTSTTQGVSYPPVVTGASTGYTIPTTAFTGAGTATNARETWVSNVPGGSLTVTVPWQGLTRFGPIEFTKGDVNRTFLSSRNLVLVCSTSSGTQGQVYVAGSDDFEAFYFVGVPRMLAALF